MMNKIYSMFMMGSIIVLSFLFFSCSNKSAEDSLKVGFLNPPDSARPGVYWYFMDGNLNREAMTADLESMKRAGIGYVLFLEVNVGIPRGKVDFLSEEWQELYKHAVREAERLGIKIILGSGPGWAGSGGPWVTPGKSMTHLVATDTTIQGPGKFNGKLKVPQNKKPFFGEGSLTPGLKKIRDDWYEDVFVLAFPEKGDGKRIEDTDEKALYYRAPYTSQPGVLPYIVSSAYNNESKDSAIDPESVVQIVGRLHKDGILEWEVPPGKWTIMRFARRNNGAVTRPAPEPGLGFEADKFDTASFDSHYDTYVGKLIRKVKPAKDKSGGGWTMIHIDSWEMGAQNWSPHFRSEFKKRRGYDPLPFLPVYTGRIVGSREISERFLWDLRQTANELIIGNHAGRFKELGRREGFRLSIEPYDMNPAADLDLGAVADIPMCEFWTDGLGFNSSFSCIEATSVAHVKGLPVVAAEAFTADSPEAWKKYPGNMKNQGDWAFCMGINRFIYHTFAHKPLPDKYRPGMTMGPYGVHWDRGQTWWNMSDGYHKYVTRCQYVLSQGSTVTDILYLAPEGAPQVFLPPPTALEGTSVMPDKKGYSFDGCSPRFLVENAKTDNGKIVFPGGGSYSIMILPQVETMTPELLSKIKSLVNEGAVIVGNPPLKSPSMVNYPDCDRQVAILTEEIWGTGKLPAEFQKRDYGKGEIWCGEKILSKFNTGFQLKDSLNIYPDYQITVSLLENSGLNQDFTSSGSIRYIHRSLSDREIYFISNRTDSTIYDDCNFRNGSVNAEIWDPLTGNINSADVISDKNSYTLKIRLEPYQSYFVVFYHGRKNDKNQTINFSEGKVLSTLDGPWNVTFDTTWGGPENVVFETLSDWSANSDEGIRYYSGTALYSIKFKPVENADLNENSRYYLNLGKVRNLARIRLNGNDLGVVWTAPWQVEITGDFMKNENLLEIEVANLWINRLIGDEKEPWDGITDGKWPEWLVSGIERNSKRFTFTTHRYYKKEDPLYESGLLGPVRIIYYTD
ncbi:MAG TPA: glycosyl hydrolase [Bacteroidales bacterium]|nr:glycosyl hydrolase [Bacteroidales bacterium]